MKMSEPAPSELMAQAMKLGINIKTDEAIDLNTYCGNAQSLINEIIDICRKKKVNPENTRIELEEVSYEYDSGSYHKLRLYIERDKNAKELKEDIKNIENNKQWRLRQYEALKKEFGE